MSIRSFWMAGLLLLSAFASNAQTYWSTDPNLNCGAYGQDSKGTPWRLENGGYVCYVYGTLPWYAAGAGWASSIRVSAPPSWAVAYTLSFADANGADATLDFRYQGDATVYNGTYASKALYANQPLALDILGLHSQAPSYGATAKGPVTVLAECPNENACSQVQAQLIYSALPAQPWLLSAPVVWDWQTSYGWSSTGVDDGSTDTVSFVICNLDTAGLAPRTYTLNVYDAAGNLYATATTKPVPLYGSYADLLRNVMPRLPAGVFKLQVTGSSYSAFEALQFHGPSATALITSSEITPAAKLAASAVLKVRPSPTAASQLAPPRIAR